MDRETIIAIIVLIGLPAVLFPAAVWYLRSDRFSREFPDAMYQFTLFGRTVLISRHLLVRLALILVLYSWMDSFFPFPFTLAMVVLTLMTFRIATARRVDAHALSDSSEALLQRLRKMQSEIGEIRQHIEGLGHHIISKQIELEERESLRKKLDEQIKLKSEEAEFWTSLTDDQQRIVTGAAVIAMSQHARGSFGLGLVLGFFINLLATLTWTLLGNPGRDEILQKLDVVTKWFK